jgi:hypothetical protein
MTLGPISILNRNLSEKSLRSRWAKVQQPTLAHLTFFGEIPRERFPNKATPSAPLSDERTTGILKVRGIVGLTQLFKTLQSVEGNFRTGRPDPCI